MRIERTFTVAISPRDTFDYLAHVENEPRWNPWGIEVRQTSPGPVGLDTRFVGKYRRIGTAEQWLSVFEPPRRICYQSNTMNGRMTFELEPSGAGTNVHLVAEASPDGLMRLFEPLMTALMMGPHVSDLARGLERELGAKT